MAEVAGKKVPKWLAAIIIFFALAVFVGVVNGLVGGDPTVTPASPAATPAAAPSVQADPAATVVDVPEYTVAKVEDLSFGDTVRLQYRVVVPGAVDEAGLRAVVDDVVEAAKAARPFNALSVGLFASEDEIDGAYTLGLAELAPGGQWAAADTVETGDYAAMKLTVTIY
jgi:hypothetical protein